MKEPGAFVGGVLVGAVVTLGLVVLMGRDEAASPARLLERGGHESLQLAERAPLAPAVDAGVAPPRVEPLEVPKPATTPAPTADSAFGIMLYGLVKDGEGKVITFRSDDAKWLRVVSASGDSRNAEVDENGRYSVMGLPPGACRIVTTFTGFEAFEKELQLSADEPVVRQDLVLERALVLVVRGFTPEGQPLLEALKQRMPDALWSVRFSAVATAAPPGSTLKPTSDRGYDQYGIGWYHDKMEKLGGHADADPGDAMGHLELFEPLPAYVSLALRGAVLQTQRVEPGAESVTFTIPWDFVNSKFGTVRARAVDAETRQPLLEAQAELSDSQSGGFGTKPDGSGAWLWDHERPGLLELVVRCKDHEMWAQKVDLAPGADLDLGDIALGPATTIRGTVRDAEGKPRSCQVFAFPADRISETESILSRHISTSDGDGRFELKSLGRHRYELRVSSYECAARPVIVDARSGDVDDAVLVAEDGAEVAIESRWPTTQALDVDFAWQGGGLVMSRGEWRGGWVVKRRMLPGSYEAHLFDDGGALVRTIPFEVSGERLYLPLTPSP